MSGEWLALGAVAAMAAAGLGRSGSRSELSDRQARLASARDFPENLLCNLQLPERYLRQIPWVKGQRVVTIYRSVPAGVTEIRPGDWVTLDKAYARQHGRGRILSKRVAPCEVLWAGTDLNEWFYVPQEAVKGSRSVLTPPTLTREGFPWPTHYDVFHATTGLRSIRRGGFKVRSEGLASATGGGTDKAVSFTLDPRVAASILVGLFTLRAGARGEMGLVDLWDRFEVEAPGAIAMYKEWSRTSYRPTKADLKLMDDGFIRVESGFSDRDLPPGGIPIGKGWQGRDRMYYHAWWQQPSTPEQYKAQKKRRMDGFAELYKTLLATGESAHECTNPLFFGTDMEALAKLDERDLGLIVARSNISRVCLDATGAWQTGYLEHSVAKTWNHLLSRYQRDCEGPLEWSRDRHSGLSYNSPSNDRIGPFAIVDEGEPGPSTTMAYLWAMAELRVYDVSRIEVTSTMDGGRYLAEQGLAGRVSAPWFDGLHIESVRHALPGQIVFRDAATRVG